jgi:hypothetical protein
VAVGHRRQGSHAVLAQGATSGHPAGGSRWGALHEDGCSHVEHWLFGLIVSQRQSVLPRCGVEG